MANSSVDELSITGPISGSLKQFPAFAHFQKRMKLCRDKYKSVTEPDCNLLKSFDVRQQFSPIPSIRSALLLFVTYLLSCGTVQVYKNAGEPVFFSNNIHSPGTEQVDTLNVVTFNIAKAEKIQLAISELRSFADTKRIHIYLLQEMDEKGVEAIAKELGLNYLYIPIVYNKMIKKNIGNAILTTGTIERPEKLILPHSKWVNNRSRHVTIGEVTIDQRKILVYSVHTETVMMSRKNRMDQTDTIIKNASLQLGNYKYMVIGGDFNTLFSKDGRLVVEKFNSKSFHWSSTAAGSTASAFFGLIKPRLDYLFTAGLNVINAGKIEGSKSSDHYPVFATFTFQR
jgi:endonuclease/exonuclease/phosphatase family metal-dependent hydrolase